MRLFLCLAAAAAVDWQVPAYQSALTETGLRELLGLDDEQATPLIASVHRLGLANRLRSLAAAHVFATDANVELVVRWKAERGCDCEAEDLFAEPPWSTFKGNGSALDGLLNMVNETQPSVVLRPSSGRPVLVIRSSGRWRWSLPVTLDANKYAAIILDPRGQFAHPHMDCREFLHRKRAFYSKINEAALRVEGLNETLANLRSALANKFVIGLHVRTYDPSFDWPVVPPPDVSVESSTTWDESAPIKVHFEAARRVLKRHPRAVVFLASNDASVKARAKREFKDSELIYADWGMISASRRVEAPSRRRRASSLGEEVVGGLFFDFEAVRTESRDRDAPRRRDDKSDTRRRAARRVGRLAGVGRCCSRAAHLWIVVRRGERF